MEVNRKDAQWRIETAPIIAGTLLVYKGSKAVTIFSREEMCFSQGRKDEYSLTPPRFLFIRLTPINWTKKIPLTSGLCP